LAEGGRGRDQSRGAGEERELPGAHAAGEGADRRGRRRGGAGDLRGGAAAARRAAGGAREADEASGRVEGQGAGTTGGAHVRLRPVGEGEDGRGAVRGAAEGEGGAGGLADGRRQADGEQDVPGGDAGGEHRRAGDGGGHEVAVGRREADAAEGEGRQREPAG